MLLIGRLLIKKEHAHFYCNECNTVQCLEHVLVEKPKLPAGYSSTEIEVLVKGTCAFCRNKSS